MKNKTEFNWVFQQIKKRQDFLMDKDDELTELFRLCDDDTQLELVASLLERFSYIDGKRYGALLASMASYIKGLGYPTDKMIVVAMAINSQPDSSQEVLQFLKVSLDKVFDRQLNHCNNMSDLRGLYKNGYRHFIVVDEFVGSGKTIRSRFRNLFNKLKASDATIDFCILSGMEKTVKDLTAEGIPVKVFNEIPRGISDHYIEPSLGQNIACMKALENKLAESINLLKLKDHSFGYLMAEALYYKENGNIPNNVFPIFWWKRYKNSARRLTLFTRVQNGY